MAAGFHHFEITRKCLIHNGYSEKANILAHYASVYADGMDHKISQLNMVAGILRFPDLRQILIDFMRILPKINYDIMYISQYLDDKYQLWHCTRNIKSNISSEDRINESGAFGWDRVFFAARVKINDLVINSEEIKALGQAIHVFQDLFIHKGCTYTGDSHGEHSDSYDLFPNPQDIDKMIGMTDNVIKIYKILSGEPIEPLVGSQINTFWMNSEQKKMVFNKVNVIQKDIYTIT